MDLNHLHINSQHVDQSIAFYREFFGFNKIKERKGGSYFIFNDQGFMMAICPMAEKATLPEWFHFGFRLNSAAEVKDLYARMLDSKAEICEKLNIYDDFVFFRCREPAGYEIEVYWEPEPAIIR